MTRAAAWLFISGMLLAQAAQAGQVGVSGAAPVSAAAPTELSELPVAFAGPPPPELPATVARDGAGRVTVRAVRLTEPLRIDGRLDEAIYSSALPMSDFIQTEPQEGAPATEKTEVWILFDDDNVYAVARISESQPERIIANEMRRDGSNAFQNETVTFVFDTFYDRRNAVGFQITPLGGHTDGQITNEVWSRDWNTIWDVEVGRFEGGWTVEAAIPFKSLRYRPGRSQIWGFNARRVTRWKNELSHLTPIPNANAYLGVFRASLAATMVGLEAPPGSKNVDVKSYAISNVSSVRDDASKIVNDLSGDIGVDVKYAATQNLIADFTYNTDFAQVEADERQVNLTRFSLFFPEKREFFLENPGLYTFGGVGGGTGSGRRAGDSPILFYSRRIGLNQGRVVPIEVGGRLSGRVGRYSLGVLNIQTDDEPVSGSRATNFSTVRLKRDIMRRSSIGLLVTGRSVARSGIGSNTAYGVDGVFGFFDNLTINTYWAQTRTDGLSGKDTSYRTELNYNGDRYGAQLERLVVGEHFNPEIGFVRRNDIERTAGQLRFSPRPRSIESIRRFSLTGSMVYIENDAGRVEARDWSGSLGVQFENNDGFNVSYGSEFEFIPRPFRIAPGVTLPVGGYDSASLQATYNFGRQRPISGRLSAERGTFFSGHKTTVGVTGSRVSFSPQLSVEPSYSINWVDLDEGTFTTTLAGSRVIYTISPWMFTSALLQYSSGANVMSANVRLRWEYRPGSQLFVVYNEERDTLTRRFPDLVNRAFIVKVNRLLRF